MLWIIAAILSAVFAGVTSILAKCGIKKTDSDLATAIRTIGGADLFVGDGVRSRIARHDCGNRAQVTDLFDSLGACHGRFVDLLL